MSNMVGGWAAKTCLAVTVMLPAAAFGDEVHVGQVAYRDVLVTGVQDNDLLFRIQSTVIRKPMGDVSTIVLSGKTDFNNAEERLGKGDFEAALADYMKAGANAHDPWMKSLIKQRMEAAQAKHIPGKKSEVGFRGCLACNDAGWMKCGDCQGGGYVVCKSCGGKGRATCPSCNGQWFGTCPGCNGTGKVGGEKTVTVGQASQTVALTKPCAKCAGEGSVRKCMACSKGQVDCSACLGTGHDGECETCKSMGRVRCTRCRRGQKPLPCPTQRLVDASTPELKSPQAFLDFLGTYPAAANSASVAVTAWRTKLHGFQGKYVRWTVAFKDLARIPLGFRLQGTAGDKLLIGGLIDPGPASLLIRAGEGSEIEIVGKIKQFYAKKGDQYQIADRSFRPDQSASAVELEDLCGRVTRLVRSSPTFPSGEPGRLPVLAPGYTICPACEGNRVDIEATRRRASTVSGASVGSGGTRRVPPVPCAVCQGRGQVPRE